MNKPLNQNEFSKDTSQLLDLSITELKTGSYNGFYRIQNLLAIAKEEGISVSQKSLQNLHFYLQANFKTPSIFLEDNGNFRIMWAAGSEQLAFEFKDDGTIQYVIFATRKNNLISRSSGNDNIENILPLIRLNKLKHLVFL